MNKISVITINFNNFDGLLNTCESVQSQTIKSFEHIIIDGASTDESRQYLKLNRHKFSLVISEPDNGIYDAMNKGIKLSTGDYLIFLNSGDFFNSQCELEFLEDIIDKNNGYNNYFFGVKRGTSYKLIPKDKTLSDIIWIGDTAPHQGTVMARKVFEKIGLYKSCYKIAGDMEFFARSLDYGLKNDFYGNRIIVEMQPGGIGSLDSLRALVEKVTIHVLYVRNKKILARLIQLIINELQKVIRKRFFRYTAS